MGEAGARLPGGGGALWGRAGAPRPRSAAVRSSRQIAQPLCFGLARRLAFDHARRFLGLQRCPQLFNMGLGLPQATRDYFLSLDMPIFELYGLSESSGVHALSRQQDFRLLRWVPVDGRMDGRGRAELASNPHPSAVQCARSRSPRRGVHQR